MTMQPDELKAARKNAGMSQAQLGEAIGMARETIGAMERGTASIELRTELAVRYLAEPRGDRTAEHTAAAFLGQGPAATAGSWQEVAAKVMPFLIELIEERYELRAKGPSVKGLFSDLTSSRRR